LGQKAVFRFLVGNCGLTVANNINISAKVTNGQNNLNTFESGNNAIQIPNQEILLDVDFADSFYSDAKEQKIKLYAEVEIKYESETHKYLYGIHYVFEPLKDKCSIVRSYAT